jgi:ATP-binding cassette, subfamily B, bacterial MsbA
MFQNVKKLGQFIRPHKREVILIFVSGIGLGIVSIFPALVIGLLTNALEQKNLAQKVPEYAVSFLHYFFSVESVHAFLTDNKVQLKVAALGFPLTYLIVGGARYYNYSKTRYFAEFISNELRVALLNRIVSLNYKFFSSLQSGSSSLLSRTLNDTILIQQGLVLYMELIREPFVALISLGGMIWVNPQLTLICLIFSPIVAFVIRKVSVRLRSLSSTSQENLDTITKSFKETVDGIRVIHAYNLEEYAKRRFREKINHYNSIRKKISKRAEISSPINEFLASIAIGGLCLYIGKMTFKGDADVSSFLMFIAFAANLEKPLKKIQQSVVGIQQTEVSIERVFQIIESPEVVRENSTLEQKSFPTHWQTIELRNVSFDYGDKRVLNNISLTVKRGQTIALIGESGGGKSTLVNLLERFYDPTDGEILIDGINIQHFSLQRLREEMAYVSQDTFIFDETIEENIRFGNTTKTHEEMVSAAQKANALPFIQEKSAGFQTRTGERGTNLSGGQKQRLSIARALFKDAPILILDEATSALDSASEAEVQKGIATLLVNRTSFVVAHRLSTIQSADVILVLERGEIVEKGTHAELITRGGFYSKYYQLQQMSGKA